MDDKVMDIQVPSVLPQAYAFPNVVAPEVNAPPKAAPVEPERDVVPGFEMGDLRFFLGFAVEKLVMTSGF